jgi:hypothetical protein
MKRRVEYSVVHIPSNSVIPWNDYDHYLISELMFCDEMYEHRRLIEKVFRSRNPYWLRLIIYSQRDIDQELQNWKMLSVVELTPGHAVQERLE